MSFKEKFNALKNNPDVSLKEIFSFGSGQFGNAMGQDSVGTYSEQFMYDYMGLSTDSVLALKTVTKGVNIVTAPLIGMLLDRNRSGKGNARRFMAVSAVPLTLSSVMLFCVPSDSLAFRLIWTFLLYLTFNIADTFYDVSLMTLSARMTTNVNARKNFYTFANFASSLGSMLPGWILPIAIDMQKDNFNAERNAYLLIAVIFGLLGLLTMLVPCLTLRERVILAPPQAEMKVKESKAKIDFKLVMLNKPLLLLSASQVIDSIRQVCYSALPFFYKQTLNNFSMKSYVEVASGTLSYLGLASVPFIGKKISPRDIISFGYLFTGICYVLLSIFGYNNKIIVGILIAIAGCPNYAMGAARKIVLADSTDYMEWKSYKKYGVAMRNEGMVFSFNTMTNRISGLWKDLIINFGLKLIGYKSATVVNGQSIEAIQTPKTLKGIFLLVVVPGILGNILPGLLLRFDDFNGKKKEKILAELAEIRKLESMVKEISESLKE